MDNKGPLLIPFKHAPAQGKGRRRGEKIKGINFEMMSTRSTELVDLYSKDPFLISYESSGMKTNDAGASRNYCPVNR